MVYPRLRQLFFYTSPLGCERVGSSSAAPATSYTQNDTPFMLFIAGAGAVGIAIILKMRFGLKV